MKSKFYTIIIILVLMTAGTVPGQTSNKDLAEIVKKNQEMLDEMQSEIDDLNSYLEEDEDDFFGNIGIHGFISQGYIRSKNANWFMEDATNDGSFQFNEIGLNFTSQLNDKLRFGLQILSRDFGYVDNNKIQIDWAYLDYKYEDWLGLRVGKVKSPLGLKSETRDIDMLRTNIILPVSEIYNEATRESFNAIQGVTVYGNVDIDVAGALDYTVQFGHSYYNVGDGGVTKLIEGSTTQGVHSIGKVNDINNRKAFLTRINWETPLDGLLLGVAYMKHETYFDVDLGYDILIPGTNTIYIPEGTKIDLTLNNYKTYVASMQYSVGDLVLSSEFARTTYQSVFGALRTLDYEKTSWYVMADYRVNDFFSIAGGYSELIDSHDPDGHEAVTNHGHDYAAWTKDIFVSTKFDITDNWIFKAELHYLDGYMFNLPEINPKGYDDQTDYMLVLKTTVSF